MLSMTLALLLSQTPKLAAPSWTAVEVSPEKAQFFALHLSSALRDRGLSVITSQDIATRDKGFNAENRARDPSSSPEFGRLPLHATPRFFPASRNS